MGLLFSQSLGDVSASGTSPPPLVVAKVTRQLPTLPAKLAAAQEASVVTCISFCWETTLPKVFPFSEIMGKLRQPCKILNAVHGPKIPVTELRRRKKSLLSESTQRKAERVERTRTYRPAGLDSIACATHRFVLTITLPAIGQWELFQVFP